MKKISFHTKPTNNRLPSTADAWVENHAITDQKEREQMKRLTIDVPLSLHKRIKSQCAMGNLVMADEIRELLEKRFPKSQDSDPSTPTTERIPS